MHYVNCIMCDAYYSADGNPYYITDANDMLCESCGEETYTVKKTVADGKITYNISNEYLSDMHYEWCSEVADKLEKHGIPYNRIMQAQELIDTFTILETDAIAQRLRGIDIDKLFHYHV